MNPMKLIIVVVGQTLIIAENMTSAMTSCKINTVVIDFLVSSLLLLLCGFSPMFRVLDCHFKISFIY